MSAKTYAFSPRWIGQLFVAEVVEVPEVNLRLVLVVRVIVGLWGVLVDLIKSPCSVAQMFFGFWFLKSAEKIDGVDKFFF